MDRFRLATCTLVAAAVALLSACWAEGPRSGGSGSCAFEIRLDGRSYSGMGGIRVIPTYGEPLGEAFVPPCDEDAGFRIEAVRIVGVDPKIAFASPDREETIFIADSVNELPPSLQRLRRAPRCDHGEAPVELTGQWLGIVDPGVDLIPPYRLQMRVDLATVSHYERTFPTLRVESELRRPLRRRDLRSSLWQGGSISVTATCVRGQFHAQEVAALPG